MEKIPFEELKEGEIYYKEVNETFLEFEVFVKSVNFVIYCSTYDKDEVRQGREEIETIWLKDTYGDYIGNEFYDFPF